MRAVILAGGEGMRLRPYTTVLPKPLMPLGNRPVLELILNQLRTAGFDEIDLSVGHLGGLIKAYLSESTTLEDELAIKYHWETVPLGTAGSLRLIDRPEEPFLVMNGDILTTLDYGELMNAHRREEAALTIATHEKSVQLSLGVIEDDPEGRAVVGFREKPTLNYRVSMGIYVYSPSTLDCIPDRRFDFPDVVHELLNEGKYVHSYPFGGEWFDIGTRDEHERAMARFEERGELFEPTSG
jgi:NDP-sugar pyrophosphorylase family protein